MNVRQLERRIVEADAAADLRQQTFARASRLQRAARKRARERVQPELGNADAAVDVARDVRRRDEEAVLRSELTAERVIETVAAAQHGLVVQRIGEAGARLDVVTIRIEQRARHAVDAGKQQPAFQIRTRRTFADAGSRPHSSGERVRLIEGQAANEPILGVDDATLVIPA